MPPRWWNPLDRLGDLGRVIQVHLDTILTLERANYRRLGALLMASAELKAMLDRIDAATNNIADDVRRLKDGVKPGMTDAEVAEVQAQGDAIATRLETLAASTEDPVPEPPAA